MDKSVHSKYKEWDSWSEELWISPDSFSDQLKKIWFKLWHNKNIISKEDALVLYYTDKERVTWYELQKNNVNKLLNGIYSEDT